MSDYAAVGRLNARLATRPVTVDDGGAPIEVGQVYVDGEYNATVSVTEDGLTLGAAHGNLSKVIVRVHVSEFVDGVGGCIDMPPEHARALRDALTEALGEPS